MKYWISKTTPLSSLIHEERYYVGKIGDAMILFNHLLNHCVKPLLLTRNRSAEMTNACRHESGQFPPWNFNGLLNTRFDQSGFWYV